MKQSDSTDNIRNTGTSWILLITPSAMGFATAALMVFIAAGPARVSGDMTTIHSGVTLLKDISKDSSVCGTPLPPGWVLFCQRNGQNQCESRLTGPKDIWIRTSNNGCWVRARDIRFKASNLALSDPPGTRASGDLMLAAQNVWTERIKAHERAKLKELEGLVTKNRWNVLIRSAEQAKKDQIVYSKAGLRHLQEMVGEARLVQAEALIDSFYKLFSSLEQDSKHPIRVQDKVRELVLEEMTVEKGLKDWKWQEKILSIRYQVLKKRMKYIKDRAIQLIADKALKRYIHFLRLRNSLKLMHIEGNSYLCADRHSYSGRRECRKARHNARMRMRRWNRKWRDCTFNINAASLTTDIVLSIVVKPVCGQMEQQEIHLEYEWKGHSKGFLPKQPWDVN